MALLGRLLGSCGMLFVAAFGCRGETGDGDGDGGAAPVAADDFPARFARAYCSSIAACCRRFEETFDEANCTSVAEAQLRGAITVQLTSPRVVFDELVAGECVEAYAAALSACTDRAVANDVEEHCEGLFKGTVPLGGACGDSDECSGEGAWCDAGVCTDADPYVPPEDQPRGVSGQACSQTCRVFPDGGYGCGSASGAPDTEATCWIEDGLACAADHTCQPAPELGEPCPSFYCAAGSYCAAGTCATPSASGPCSSELACVESSYCDYDLGQCRPRKPDGDLCNSGEECLGRDCEGDRCRQWSVASAESCAGQIDD